MAGCAQTGFLSAMRTVPVILKTDNRKIKVTALLDEASTKSFINTDVPAELGLQGKLQKVNVNVLNGQTETFKTMAVAVELENFGRQREDNCLCIHSREGHRKHKGNQLGKLCCEVDSFEGYSFPRSWI